MELYRDLVLIVPSRGRPKNLRRLLDCLQLTVDGDTHLCVGLDADDPTLEEYQDVVSHSSFANVQAQVRSDLSGVVAWTNYLAYINAKSCHFLGSLGDDNVPLQVGWDIRVCRSLNRQHTGFCYGDDGYGLRPKGALATHVFMTSNIVQALGYMGPPQLKHMFVDDAWTRWGQGTSIEFLSDMRITHRHYSVGKAAHDETYVRAEMNMSADQVIFAKYCTDPDGLAGDIARIKAIPDPPVRNLNGLCGVCGQARTQIACLQNATYLQGCPHASPRSKTRALA